MRRSHPVDRAARKDDATASPLMRREHSSDEQCQGGTTTAAVLELQRQIGNATISRLLAQREPGAPVSLGMRGPPVPDPRQAAALVLVDYGRASDAVRDWLDRGHKGGDGPALGVLTIAEIVNQAGKLDFTKQDGGTGKVSAQIRPNEIELQLRTWGKHRGVALLDNRDPGDVAGTQSQIAAVLENLGNLPTSVKLGGDKANLKLHLAGKVTGRLQAGDVTIEGEGAPSGGTLSVTDKRGGGAEVKGGPDGVGGSIKVPGGPKLGMELSNKSVKLELKAGDFEMKGGIENKGSEIEWTAEMSLGTIGKLVTGTEIAKMAASANESLTHASEAMRDGLSNENIKAKAEPLKKSVGEVAETAKKIAETKPGWRLGLEAKGSPSTGVSVGVTLTWVF